MISITLNSSDLLTIFTGIQTLLLYLTYRKAVKST